MKLKIASAVFVLVGLSAWAAAPPGRYVLTTDTVRDSQTNLTWQRSGPSAVYNQPDATLYCQGLSLGGFATGWRLPNLKELQTLVDVRSINPAIDSVAFPGTVSSAYWSSSPYVISTADAWVVGFYYGQSYSVDLTNAYHVRCVR
jgi:hypothetical protein